MAKCMLSQFLAFVKCKISVLLIIMNSQIKFLISLVVIVGLFFFLQEKFHFLDISITQNTKEEYREEEKEEDGNNQSHEKSYVEIYTREGNVIKVNTDIAKSPQERTLGLSHRKYIGSYDGMWFIFEEDTEGGFWMKDMLIPLDIIFVDSSGFIVDIKETQQICSDDFCPTIKPSKPYRYVLEVNANFCKENGITIGDSIKSGINNEDNV